MAFSQKRSEAAFERIHELGGGGVWESDMVAISLDGTNIADDDLELFKDFDFVEILGLSDTKITDAGLVHLEQLTRLQTLALVNTKVTSAGVAKLRAALPNADIVTEPPPTNSTNPFTGESFGP